MRRWAAVLLSGLALAGCDREAPEAAAPKAAAASLPLSYASKTKDVEVALTLPAALRAYPTLHRTLYESETKALNAFAAENGPGHAAFGAQMPAFFMEVKWAVAAETPRLLSLTRDASEFAGGNHPNSNTTTLLFDKQAGREVTPAALFPTAGAGLDGALCEVVKREKALRGLTPLDGDTWPCPKWRESDAALTPGAGGKAGGLTFLFSPYEVGPFFEGPFEVSVPASAFAGQVAPEYRDQFAS